MRAAGPIAGGSGSRCHGCRQFAAAVRLEGEYPQLGPGLLAPAAEENITVFREDSDGLPLEEDTAVVVTEGPYPHQVVVEAGHAVAADVQRLWERNVAGS